MATISQKIPNLIGGVSQQADAFKLAGQLRTCTNFFPDPAFGLIKRPGLKGLGKLSGAAADGTWFMAVRDDQERYVIQFSKTGTLKIWDADTGVAKTINTPAASATTYATHSDSSDLALLQINDYYFVLNRKTVTAMDAAASPAKVNFAFVAVNAVGADQQYKITLNSTDYTITTSANHGRVTDVLDKFTTNVTGNANINSGAFNATAVGNCLYIEKDDGADFDIKAVGGGAGTALSAYKGEVPSVAILPQQFKNNAIIKVTGDKTVNGDDYYVKFIAENGATYGAGKWQETIAPDTKLRFDGTTMPHVIIREANGTFTFRNLNQVTPTGSATITGVPTAVSITTDSPGSYKVGDSFPVYGGTGKDLRLEVTSTYTKTTTTTPSIATSYVSFFVYNQTYNFRGVANLVPLTTYSWVYNGKTIASNRSNLLPLTVGTETFSVNGGAVLVASNPQGSLYKYPIKVVSKVPNTINGVKIARAGSGYTNGDVVKTDQGTTFTITNIGTATGKVDDPAYKHWEDRVVGDTETNPDPSFIGHPISGIAFYKNRLIFLSNENVVCSQAGSYFDFFASTVITIVDSDPIDISCGSLRPVQLQHSLQVPRGLMLFADNAQYILETSTEAFSPSTAEINLVASFSMDARVEPADSGGSFMILDQTNKAASVRELLVIADSSVKPQSADITRLIPSYLPAQITQFKASSTSNTLAILSDQEPNAIYMYRWLNSEGRSLMNSWFKWTVPGNVELISFDNENLYLVTMQPDPFLSKVNLVTETSSGPLLYDGQYVDTRLDLYNYDPTLVYLAGTDQTKVCFKEGIESVTNATGAVVSLDPQSPGFVRNLTIQYDAAAPVGQKYFVLIDGDQTTQRWALGLTYEAEAELPAFYYKPSENTADTLNIPTIYRVNISSYNSGPYSTIVSADGKEDFTLELPQRTSNLYLADTLPMLRNPTNAIPVMAKGDEVSITIKADYPFPTALNSLTWQGSINTKGFLVK